MIISIANLKGGSGKTTLAQNLAACFTNDGKRVCLIDTDSESNVSLQWGADRSEEGLPPVMVVTTTEKTLADDVLDKRSEYDVVIIDGTPAKFEFSSQTVLASDLVVIPVIPSIGDVRVTNEFLKRYRQVKRLKDEKGWKMEACIALNKYSENQKMDREVRDHLAEYDVPVLETRLGHRVAYKEAMARGRGVVEYVDRKAKEEMARLYAEIKAIADSF